MRPSSRATVLGCSESRAAPGAPISIPPNPARAGEDLIAPFPAEIDKPRHMKADRNSEERESVVRD
jgi:hypothetical protein